MAKPTTDAKAKAKPEVKAEKEEVVVVDEFLDALDNRVAKEEEEGKTTTTTKGKDTSKNGRKTQEEIKSLGKIAIDPKFGVLQASDLAKAGATPEQIAARINIVRAKKHNKGQETSVEKAEERKLFDFSQAQGWTDADWAKINESINDKTVKAPSLMQFTNTNRVRQELNSLAISGDAMRFESPIRFIVFLGDGLKDKYMNSARFVEALGFFRGRDLKADKVGATNTYNEMVKQFEKDTSSPWFSLSKVTVPTKTVKKKEETTDEVEEASDLMATLDLSGL